MKNLEKWKELKNEDIEEIIYNYREKGEPLNIAGEKFSLDGSQVRNLLKTKNIKQRRIAKDNRKYKVNDKYFNEESPNMAYILGFWAADGNVHSKENRLDLELSSVDYEILGKIKEEISCERPIKIYECADGYKKNKLFFWSKEIKNIFREYGIVPNKTYSKDFTAPYKLNREYWIDYIRGFFDGDGCVKKGTSLTFELNSTNLLLLQEISNHLEKFYEIKTQISTCGEKGRNIPLYRLYCYGKEARKVFNILYTENSLFLKRKYSKWFELL